MSDNNNWYIVLTGERESCFFETTGFKMNIYVNRNLTRYKIETTNYEHPQGICITESFWKTFLPGYIFSSNCLNHQKKFYKWDEKLSWTHLRGTILRSTTTIIPNPAKQIHERELTGQRIQYQRKKLKKHQQLYL